MDPSDIMFIIRWWLMFFIIGLIFLPLTTRIFSNFFDKGYIFAKAIGMAFISYAVFVLGILKVLPFTFSTIVLILAVFVVLNILISRAYFKSSLFRHSGKPKAHPESEGDSGQARMTGFDWKIFLFEEILFILTLFFWSYIRAHAPDIHGLEKYMDFGFINSILRSEYFPPADMWFTPYPINYYYFGHLVTAVLTKISTIPSSTTYNLMLSTIFAFTFSGVFSIGANLFYKLKWRGVARLEGVPSSARSPASWRDEDIGWDEGATGPRASWAIIGGLLTALLASLAGNLHTIYIFFKPYVNENPAPFWQLVFSPNSSPNSYWYPNATRFIPNTIHEFPIYSSVVSDLHGHYLDVPFVLLTIALLLSIFLSFTYGNHLVQNSKFKIFNFGLQLSTFNFQLSTLLAFLLAIMYMTNAWDGIIYFLLTAFIILYIIFRPKGYPVSKEIKNEKLKIKNSFQIENFKFKIRSWIIYLIILGAGLFIFSLSFNLNFKPFASGIGILCAPEFLTNIGKLGPFLFEKDHCQRSPIWQLAILYGFFYFWAVSFIIFIFKKINPEHEYRNPKQIQNSKIQNSKPRQARSKRFGNLDFEHLRLFRISNFEFRILSPDDIFVLILILLSTFLIIIPEFIYVKDIYPGHYRANTMFKLVYQTFIMLSIASGYIIVRKISNIKYQISNIKYRYWKFVYWTIGIIGLFLVMIYPYFAINSYYGDLKTYYSLDGTLYLKKLYPTDYESILWINKNIKGQPVILEAQGDSYTDYARVSSNTGLPTVLGWTVHEWLWRGTYDIPSPRIEEVQKMYESEDLEDTKNLLKKYKVELVFFGDLERQKYSNLIEGKFKTLGKVIYKNGNTRIYKVD